ncbi:hypothetical protein ES319_A05G369500v1 [Gossypium barbadense]|uniref:Endonuclease/exonuclease/phosphatase domain-containing protein n=1 Tax=Gossypium barbadense TaxID=3634 RepID=A0A5J5VZ03_GOSBA|nr:hypothetical protein ES319_A05G369500v1 [Gossypium barbadense]
MDDFQMVMDELALVDVKPDKGWFTWTNNHEGNSEVRECLDRFLVLASWSGCVLFLPSSVLRRTCSDHDAILLDTLGRKSREDIRDSRLSFQFEACWANRNEAKDMIKRVWDQCKGVC